MHHLGVEDDTFADQVAVTVFSISAATFECAYRVNGAYTKVTVAASQQQKTIDVEGFHLRFSNYDGHIYIGIFDNRKKRTRKATLSLMGEYISFYPKDSPNIYCIRL